ncbi:MAG: hypothetical protein RL681_459 [Candidatus Parcubacteria bacterium]
MTIEWLLSLDGLAWSASFVNVLAMALQLRALVKSRETKGTSLGMLIIFVYVQTVFCFVGHRSGQQALFWGMLLSGVITTTIFGFVVYLRHWLKK